MKQASNRFAPAEPAELATKATPASDPTLVNAGLTELQDTSVSAAAAAQETAQTSTSDQMAPPPQTLADGTGNSVAERTYNPASMTSSATTDGWVNIPRDPAETDTGLQATPANLENADAAAAAKAQAGGRNRNGRQGGRGRGDGNRGGRGRGEFRGRARGGRGRGRGGANGSPAAATPSGEQ